MDGSKSKDDKEDFMSWVAGDYVAFRLKGRLKEVIRNLLERREEKELTQTRVSQIINEGGEER